MGNKASSPCRKKDAGDACEVKEDDRIENATYTCQALDDDKDKLTCSVNACTAGFQLNTARDACLANCKMGFEMKNDQCVAIASDLSPDPAPDPDLVSPPDPSVGGYTFTQGKDRPWHDLGPGVNVSLDGCRTRCDNNGNCAGFSHNAQTNWCYIKKASVLKQPQTANGFTFYKKPTPGSTESYIRRRTMAVAPTGFSLNSRGFASIAEF